MADLWVLSKPSRQISIDKQHVPADVHDLYQELSLISHMVGLIPKAVVERFRQLPNTTIHAFQVDTSCNTDVTVLHNQVTRVVSISIDANTCFADEHSEPSWNYKVHTPLLELALSGIPEVGEFNITRASPCPIFVKLEQDKHQREVQIDTVFMQSKLVDYSINIKPEPDTPFAHFIHDVVATQEPGLRTLMPTMYVPVRLRPQAIVIETKVDKSPTDPLLQLYTWARATCIRLQQLMLLNTADIITQPLLQAVGHDWKLWFARDTASHIDLYGPVAIGSTKTVLGTYKLVRSLRALGWWAAGPYRQWFEAEVLGIS
ncbi:uncharacterized protein BCR38DRAFT_489663 [Pseudomassariella vexata]|uniref:PD-(D/E)XK nuclease-like domain-containing protein n=1 Tax=Pseudomassariella vexata TaxID=1141098 RepID=A0A1Y2DGD8_9PEZI|nr:uncharacterized protein BCR38DRAFT_489663 [Pseudomassariella vexata]ORY58186.1 hypothetical protein BCR38DRAFT_489663 [Pseudomassariella vexata]